MLTKKEKLFPCLSGILLVSAKQTSQISFQEFPFGLDNDSKKHLKWICCYICKAAACLEHLISHRRWLDSVQHFTSTFWLKKKKACNLGIYRKVHLQIPHTSQI